MNNYRDIILFPKFKNEDKIQEIRSSCDKLYDCISPHITIVFPFLDDISDNELVEKVKEVVKDEKKFIVEFSGISYSNDDYIFLNCNKGNEEITKLHDLIYNKVLKDHLSNIKYIPHITLGQKYNCSDYTKINNLTDTFACEIDTIYIEKIGINDESIIIDKISLN